MTTIADTILTSAGAAANGWLVEFKLVDAFGRDGIGFSGTVGGVVVATTRLHTGPTGAFSTPIIANSLIDQANTYYRVTIAGDGETRVKYIQVPAAGGPYTLGAVLYTPPSDLPTIPVVTKSGVGAIVYLDPADNLYKYWNTLTNSIGPTTSSTDAGVVFNAAFTATGGLVGFYQNLNVKVSIAPISGTGIVGSGSSKGVSGNAPRLLAATGLSGAIIAFASTSIVNVSLMNLGMNAGSIATQCVNAGGTDYDCIGVAGQGGTTHCASFAGVRGNWVNADFGNPASGSLRTISVAGSDGMAVNVRLGNPNADAPILEVVAGTNGWQLDVVHTNGEGHGAPPILNHGDLIVFTNLYVDGVHATASVRQAGDSGALIIAGIILRNGGSPGVPMFSSLSGAGGLFVSGGFSETFSGGTNWSSVWDGAAGTSAQFVNCNFSAVTPTTFAGCFPTSAPTVCDITVNGHYFHRGIGGVISVAASQTQASSVADVAVTGATFTIPNNSSNIGTTYYFIVRGVLTNNDGGGACNFTFKVKIAGTAVSQAVLAVPNATVGAGFVVDGTFTVQTLGAGGTCMAEMEARQTGGNPQLSNTNATTAMDTTSDRILSVTIGMARNAATVNWTAWTGGIELVSTGN